MHFVEHSKYLWHVNKLTKACTIDFLGYTSVLMATGINTLFWDAELCCGRNWSKS
jgi:hypothetical protein